VNITSLYSAMKKRVYLIIFDGLADWEPALALCAIRNTNKFEIITVGFTKETITSMGGLKMIPDITLDEVDPELAAILILPGGDMWENQTFENIISLLHRLREYQVPIAAICGATLEVCRSGIIRGVRHTSNTREYLKSLVPNYLDEGLYVESMAVSDQGIITASGAGFIEFADEIIKTLEIYTEQERQVWFNLFKHGVMPQE
jgi:putative intracellular protease/amidase